MESNEYTLSYAEKGRILEHVVSLSLWKNNILHNHNAWDDPQEYNWGGGGDHYLIDLKITIECKNFAKKTVQNISPAWLDKQVLARGTIDILIITYELRPEMKEYLFSKGVSHIITIGFQVNPKNFDDAFNKLNDNFHSLFIEKNNSQFISNSLAVSTKDVMGVCNSGFIISYFIDYLLVSYVIDSIVNVFYMIIDDKPKITDPPNDKNNKIIDDCVSETNNTSNIIYKKSNSINKFYLTLNPNKITSKIKNRLNKINHRLTNCLNNPNKLNPTRFFSEKMPQLPFASFG